MIEQVCAYIHNFFTHEKGRPIHCEEGTFRVEDGGLMLDFLQDGNYYLIRGSDFNDGVHLYPSTDLTDEVFTGKVYKMRPKPDFLKLVEEITAWQEQYGAASASPFSSEHFGSYSYTKARSYASAGGGMESSWQSIFDFRLNQYRKLCSEV